MRKTTRNVVALATGVAAAVALAAPTAFASVANPLDYQLTTEIGGFVDGPASNTSANVIGDVRPELIVSVYGPFTIVAGEAVLVPGRLEIYTPQGNPRRGGEITNWKKVTVFDESANIVFPSQVQVDDVDGDGDKDLLLGSGFFWDSNLGVNRGTITWWENRELPRTRAERGDYVRCLVNSRTWAALNTCIKGLQTWERHDVRVGAPASYHDLDYKDLDADGIKDIVTVGEQGITRPLFTDDIVELEFYKGLGGGNFAPVVVLANAGGSSPKVIDVDGDGDMDIASAQFFRVSPIVLGPPAGDASFVWFENTSSGGPLTAANFTKHEISRGQGPSYGIYPVPNLFGDGQLRYIGVNHTNNTPGTPGPPFFLQAAPNVFLLTPGADIRAPWTASVLASSVDPGAAFRSLARPGQASPGKPIFNDLDNDGDLDIALSGDGDFRGFIVEQTAPGVFHQSVLEQSTGWGQGGITVNDFNRDGKSDIVMSSFELDKIGLWQRLS